MRFARTNNFFQQCLLILELLLNITLKYRYGPIQFDLYACTSTKVDSTIVFRLFLVPSLNQNLIMFCNNENLNDKIFTYRQI